MTEKSTDQRKFDWDVLKIIAPLLIALVGWCISIEVRLKGTSIDNLTRRIETIETVMVPLLVEHKVNDILKEYGISDSKIPKLTTPPSIPAPMPPSTPLPIKLPDVGQVRRDAEVWAKERFSNDFNQR
jgi:hypothetical protein